MKTKLKTALVALALYATAVTNTQAQCLPLIKIDANELVADENNPSGIKLPSWLAAGQTLAKGQNVYSIAVIEFTVNGTALDYSRNISVSTLQTVPAGKVWKVESIHKDPAYVPVVASYTTPGTYSFTPTCSGNYLLQVWGAGSAGHDYFGGGGGGGGYTEGYFYLLSTNTYTVTVGAGGAGKPWGTNNGLSAAPGGNSSFGSLCTASGGGAAPYSSGAGAGGAGLTQYGASGTVYNGSGSCVSGGRGGGLLGGAGGSGCSIAGTAPGGGGSGSNASGSSSGSGAAGSVIISLNANLGGGSRVPCTSLYLYGNGTAPLCPSGWNDGGVGILGPGPGFCRTCFRCD